MTTERPMTTKEACETLDDAVEYLTAKTFNGDQGGDCMNYWEWNVVMCSAIGILEDRLSAVYLGARYLGCEHLTVQNSEDQYGELCGKKCEPGQSYCNEHQEQSQ